MYSPRNTSKQESIFPPLSYPPCNTMDKPLNFSGQANSFQNPLLYSAFHQLPFLENSQSSLLLENASMDEMNAVDHKGNTPLIWAVSEGRGDIVRLLVDSGADVNIQNFEGMTSLYLAVEHGDLEISTYLMENGANVNIQNETGQSAAHIASINGHLDCLQALAAHGAHLEIKDDYEETPLHFGVRGGFLDVVRFLVEDCRVNSHCYNEDMETPLQMASCFEETSLVEYLTAVQTRQEEHEGSWKMVFNSSQEKFTHNLPQTASFAANSL